MKVKDSGEEYEHPEPGTYGAVCYKLVDMGTQENEYEGKRISRRQLILFWEIDERMADGKPFVISAWYTCSLHEQAKLRGILEAWRGVPFTPEELKGFDLKNVLGKACMLSVTKNEKGKVRVSSVSKIPKGMTPPIQVNPTFYFSFDSFDQTVFDSLSDKMKKIIMQSPEYQAVSAGKILNNGIAVEEKVPF